MKQTTIEEVLTGAVEIEYHELYSERYRLYAVRDGDLTLYVGQSVNPIDRIQAHCGMGTFGWAGLSWLGQTIKDNLPESRQWTVILFTLADCFTDCVDRAEGNLITVFRPCLNIAKNRNGRALPEKYIRERDRVVSQNAIDTGDATAWRPIELEQRE